MKALTLLLTLLLVLVGAVTVRGAEDPAVRLTVLGSMERIALHDEPWGPSEARIQAARNEWESFQVVVAAGGENVSVTAMEITDLAGPEGAVVPREKIRLYREEYARVRQSTPRADLPPGLHADPLVPLINPITGQPIEPRKRSRERWGGPIQETGHDMYAVPFDVFRGQNQPIWVDVHVPKDAVAGIYRGTFRIRASGRGTLEIPVTLTVWDFALPDGPTHGNHFGSFRNVARYFDVDRDSDEFRDIEMRYCKALAEHRLNPPIPTYLLPEVNLDGSLEIVPERHEALKAFLGEMHISEFEIPRAPFARLRVAATGEDYKRIAPEEREKAIRYYREYHDYLTQNGWDDGAYVYLWDEPNLRENYEQVLVLGGLVHEAEKKLRNDSETTSVPRFRESSDAVKRVAENAEVILESSPKCLVVEQTYPHDPSWPDIDPAVDIWCPLWAFIDRSTIEAKIAGGDEVWSYTALVQRAPPYHPQYDQVKGLDPPYWHIDRPLIVYRIPTWINRQYGITGLLYWTTVTTVLDPWNNPAFAHPRHYNGGGYLLYPGAPCGIDGPIASTRLKNLRDGMEDYEYFAILQQKLGDEPVKHFVDQIAPNWWEYCRDPDELLKVRRQLAERIVAAE